MKLGYVIPEFPGQTHSFFWREIVALEALGNSVDLISTRRPRSGVMPHAWAAGAAARTTYLFPLSLTEAADAAIRLPGAIALVAGELRQRPWRDRGEILAALPFALKLRAFCARRGIEHLHLGSCAWTALIAALCRLLGGPRYSLTLHNPVGIFGGLQDLKWGQAAFGSAITRQTYEDLVAQLGDHLPTLLFIQPMGVDVERFRRGLAYQPWSPGEPLRLFSCARLHPGKGHSIALDALASLRADGIDARLRIAGEDREGGSGYRRELEAQIASLGLVDSATLLGAVDEDTIVAELCASHLFVLASDEEPLGVAYMEAMSCETPVLGTDAGGVPDLITHGVDGWLVPPRDPAAVAAALRRLADDADLCKSLAARGRETVAARFRSSLGAERIHDAIHSVSQSTFNERSRPDLLTKP